VSTKAENRVFGLFPLPGRAVAPEGQIPIFAKVNMEILI
jgi:hypothetical protein